jgi:RNA polymerase sigma-70 factor (ECF subfamily)
MSMGGPPPCGPDRPEDADLERLYRMYGQVIYIHCKRFFADPAEAEDATQETFLRVYRFLWKVPRGEDALKWLRCVARNVCLNIKKEPWNRLILVGSIEDEDLIKDGDEVGLIDREILFKLISGAPKRFRDVAYLYRIEGMDQGEVAAVLDISRRTVVARLKGFHAYVKRFRQRVEL